MLRFCVRKIDLRSRILVIGSGPVAWAACQELADKKREYTIIDTDLELNQGLTINLEKYPVNRKLLFGFDFMYDNFPQGKKLVIGNSNACSSFARGGFSNVWGATMLPYTKREHPIFNYDADELRIYIQKVIDQVGVSGESDSLDSIYGEYRYTFPSLLASERFEKLSSGVDYINKSTYYFGKGKLAVKNDRSTNYHCRLCGECLRGCRYSLIWNSATSMTQVSRLNLLKGFRVQKLEPIDNHYRVLAINKDGEVIEISGVSDIILCAGPIESWEILRNSGLVEDSRIQVRDSQIFFFPILFRKRKKEKLAFHALSEAFLRVESSDTKPLNFQLYEYTPDVVKRLKGMKIPGINLVPNRILEYFMSFFGFALGYLHSDESAEIFLESDSEHLRITTRKSVSNKSIKKAIRKFDAWAKKRGIKSFPLLKKIGLPMEGVHFGGTLPRSKYCDKLGGLRNSPRIFPLGSSILEEVPAGPITLTIMADAIRTIEKNFE